MKERPILFSVPMVRALLAGTKTQTRRFFKVRGPMGDQCLITSPDESIARFDDGSFHYLSTSAMSGPYPCPYGVLGDRLWVRESWNICDPLDAPAARHGERAPFTGCQGSHGIPWVAVFRADGDLQHPAEGPMLWRPSIHMPRWASRILLEITDVRVERLRDISEADCIAEGVETLGRDIGRDTPYDAAKLRYAALWEQINGPGSWEANPWVWCVSFRRTDG